jgi:Gamma-glutamyl cyclotransferase, AIG2-like
LSGHTFFFYGSLMDRDLLEAVIGRDANHLIFTPGWLKGYVAEVAANYSFPTLVESRHGRVDGLIAQQLSTADVERIAYFEDEDYTPIVADIATAEAEISAQFYVATARLKSSGKAWNFDSWRRRDKPLLLAVTRKVMREHYGLTPMSEIDAVWHTVKAEIEAEMLASARRKRSR